jgi:hypothetical protein
MGGMVDPLYGRLCIIIGCMAQLGVVVLFLRQRPAKYSIAHGCVTGQLMFYYTTEFS